MKMVVKCGEGMPRNTRRFFLLSGSIAVCLLPFVSCEEATPPIEPEAIDFSIEAIKAYSAVRDASASQDAEAVNLNLVVDDCVSHQPLHMLYPLSRSHFFCGLWRWRQLYPVFRQRGLLRFF